MKRCKTCKWWDTGSAIVEWGVCTLAASKNAQAEVETSLAVSFDFEGYEAGLSTNAKFGCVQWEKKE